MIKDRLSACFIKVGSAVAPRSEGPSGLKLSESTQRNMFRSTRICALQGQYAFVLR